MANGSLLLGDVVKKNIKMDCWYAKKSEDCTFDEFKLSAVSGPGSWPCR